jgi:hypothetical protein
MHRVPGLVQGFPERQRDQFKVGMQALGLGSGKNGKQMILTAVWHAQRLPHLFTDARLAFDNSGHMLTTTPEVSLHGVGRKQSQNP